MPVRAELDWIFRVTVCLRPFRAAGPRLDVERVGDKTVVHNYGHGGSGWSLSWGSSSLAVEKAMAAGERDVAVIGCGALGMTSCDSAAARRGRSDDLRQRRPPRYARREPPAPGRRDSADCADHCCFARFPGIVGKDVPYVVPYVRELSGHGGESSGMDRSVYLGRHRSRSSSMLTGTLRIA